MRILFDLSTFTDTHYGGKDEVAYNLLKGFSKIGRTSDIICVARPELEKKIKEIDAKYKIIKVKSNNRHLGLHYLYAKKIQRIVNKLNVNCVVYTNKIAPCKKLSVPTILIPHDIMYVKKAIEERGFYNLLYAKLIRINFALCDHIIAISDFDKKEMKKYLPKYSGKVIRIYDPIVFKETRIEDNREFITAINIQWPHKNVITLIKAFAKIADKIPLKLVLVGRKAFDKKTEEQIDSIISSNGISDKIVFTGYVDDQQMKEIISNTKIYVNPSLFEGFGMTAVEMIGCGIPTIVANNTAMPESTMGYSRYYGPATDADKLADEIMKEILEPTSDSLLKEATMSVKDRYDYVVVAQKYLKFIDKICKKNI